MKFKKFLSMALAAAMALSLAVPASAAKPAKNTQPAASSEKTVTLKGEQTGTEFDYDKECWSTWQNVVFLGGANENSTDEEVSAWHLVYTDKKGINNDLKSMKLTFDNGEVYEWNWDIGLSTNGSGNNPGWMVVAPASYGKINVANSFIVTTSSKNVQFNISGYYQAGSKPVEPDEPVDPDDGKVSAVFQITKFLNDMYTFGVGFTFEVVDAEGTVVATMTSDENGVAASANVDVAPGQYTIRETGLNLDKYEAVEPIEVEVDEYGNVAYPVVGDNEVDYIVNYELGALDVSKPTVMQKYDELWHTPVYAEAEGDTRVSRILSDLPDYITGDTYSQNKHTYLTINAAALANDPDGATIRIAKSDSNNTLFPDIAPENPWEDPIPLTYNLKIVDNKLVVNSTLPNFGFAVYGPEDTIKGNGDFGGFGPKHESDAENPQANTYIKSWALPKLDANGNFRFLIHYACPGYTTSKVIGCTPGAILPHECERVIDPDQVTVTVKNAAGEEVADLDKLPHGKYTVTVSVGDEVVDSQTVTVDPGETATVTFDEPLYMEKDTNEYYFCKNPNCNYYVEP